MIDSYLYDREGEPQPGAVPTPLYVYGDPLSRIARAATKQRFLDFTAAARLGIYKSLRRRLVIDDETEVEFEVNHGVFKATAWVRRGRKDLGLVGGIVVQLARVTDAAYWDNAAVASQASYPSTSQRELLSAQAGGASKHAVPGPLGTNTDSLLIQIARRGDLSSTPIKKELVRIWRIANPRVGALSGHGTAGTEWSAVRGRNVVTADYSESAGNYVVGPFYLCGQELPIPPLVAPSAGASMIGFLSDMSGVLYAYGFRPKSFAEPTASGVLLLAGSFGGLSAYDTSNPAAGWQTVSLAQTFAPGRIPRPYGREFKEELHGSDHIAITCSGSDSGGVLSGFSVNLHRSAGTFTISGDAQMATVTSSQPTSLYQYNQNVDWVNAQDVPASPQEWTATAVGGASGYFKDPQQTWLDPFLGGVLAQAFENSTSFSETFDINIGLKEYIANFLDIDMSRGHNHYTGSATINAGVLGSVITGSSTSTPSGSAGPLSGTVPTPPGHRHEYKVIDQARCTLALREQFGRTGSWGHITGSTYGAQMGGCSMKAELLDRTRAVRWDFDYTAKFAGLANAGAYSLTFNGLPPDGIGPSATAWFGQITSGAIDRFFFGGNLIDFMTLPEQGVMSWYILADAVAGAYSAGINVNRTTTLGLSVAEYEALGDLDMTGVSWPGQMNVSRYHARDSYHNTLYVFDSVRRPSVTPIDNHLVVDPRSDGYIAQMFVAGAMSDGAIHARHELVIGNDDSVVPLVDVLNEWLAMQKHDTRYDVGDVIIESQLNILPGLI